MFTGLYTRNLVANGNPAFGGLTRKKFPGGFGFQGVLYAHLGFYNKNGFISGA